MDTIDEKILNAYQESILNERKFDLGSGTMGNGVVVWNRAKEVHGDYEKVAHIDRNRKVTYYIKNPPKQVKDYVEKIAKGKNFAASTSQPDMKVFKEGGTLDEKKDEYGNVKSTVDYLQKKMDIMLDSKKADNVYQWLDDMILKKKGLESLIGELESFSKGKKVEFGKTSRMGGYIAALKDMVKSGEKFISAWDKTTDYTSYSLFKD